jgi:RNA polymerase sigma-70 factor (ECF subfamily)
MLEENKERELLERCKSGESSAYEPIVKVYEHRVFSFLYHLMGNSEDARDLTQETFIRAYRRINQYKPDKPFLNWLMTIARNIRIDFLRRSSSRIHHERPCENLGESITGESISPDQHAILNERKEMIWAALDRLKPQDREVVILKDILELKYAEIAQIMGIPQGTVASRIYYARSMLRQIITADTESHMAAVRRNPILASSEGSLAVS